MSYFHREIFSFLFTPILQNRLKDGDRSRHRFAHSAHTGGHQLCSGCQASYRLVPMAKQFSCPFLSFASMPGILLVTPDILSKTIFFPFYTLFQGPSFSPMMSHTNYGLMTWLLNLYFPRCPLWVPGLHFHLCLQHIFRNISQHDSLIYNC